MENPSFKNPVVCWFSGGVTSAVACKIAIDLFGAENCVCIMIDTKNEHKDTYRFKEDCEKWYKKDILTITAVGKGKKYESIQDVWHKYTSLNVAHGGICSSDLKRNVRVKWQRQNNYSYQVFVFDNSEIKRANNIKKKLPCIETNFSFALIWAFRKGMY